MIFRRFTVLGLLLALAALPAVSSAGPNPAALLQYKGQVQGNWCFDTSIEGCFNGWGSADNLAIFWHMDGTWARNGKTVRATSSMATTGTRIGDKTYQLAPFSYDVRDRRFGEIFSWGSCTGVAKMQALIAVDLNCNHYKPYEPDPGTFTLRVRAINERKTDEVAVVVVSKVFELAGLDHACDPTCPAPMDGVFF